MGLGAGIAHHRAVHGKGQPASAQEHAGAEPWRGLVRFRVEEVRAAAWHVRQHTGKLSRQVLARHSPRASLSMAGPQWPSVGRGSPLSSTLCNEGAPVQEQVLGWVWAHGRSQAGTCRARGSKELCVCVQELCVAYRSHHKACAWGLGVPRSQGYTGERSRAYTQRSLQGEVQPTRMCGEGSMCVSAAWAASAHGQVQRPHSPAMASRLGRCPARAQRWSQTWTLQPQGAALEPDLKPKPWLPPGARSEPWSPNATRRRHTGVPSHHQF
jgi:hypothetical protein